MDVDLTVNYFGCYQLFELYHIYSKSLLAAFMLWLNLTLCWYNIKIYLTSCAFTSRPRFLTSV